MTLPDFEGVAQFWTAVVFDVSLQFCLLAVFGAGLCVFLRKSDPRLRHLLWVLVLARLALPFDLKSPVGLSPSLESRLLGAASTGLAWFASSEEPANLGRSATEAFPGKPTSGEGRAAPTPSAEPALPTNSSAIGGIGNTLELPKLLVLLWLGGIATFGLLHWMRLRAIRSRMSRARPTDRLSSLSRALASDLGLNKEIPILAIAESELRGPVVAGSWRPTILVPDRIAKSWTDDELEAALVHELIHVRRWDPWVRTAQIVLQTLYFFHPLVWWVNRQIHRERELCCDDAVVRYYGGARRQYVETLLRCASSSRVRSPLRSITIPTLGVAGAVSRVNRRIRRMLNQNYRVPTTLSRWAVALILSAMVAATVLRVPRPGVTVVSIRDNSARSKQSALTSSRTTAARSTGIGGSLGAAI